MLFELLMFGFPIWACFLGLFWAFGGEERQQQSREMDFASFFIIIGILVRWCGAVHGS